MKVGDILESEVLGLSPTGDGVIKVDGRVIFLPLAVPGQTVRFEIKKRKKKVFFAKILEVLKKTPHEVSPLDPEFPHHGGAPWQHITYDEQLKWKEQFVIDALERIGGIKNPPVDNIAESPATIRYRNKMEFSFGHSRMRTETAEDGTKTHFDEDPGLGLHRRGSWREIVRITDTCLASKNILHVRKIIEDFALNSKKPVWNPIQRKGFWRHVTVRESIRTEELFINIQVSEKAEKAFWEPLVSLLKNSEKSSQIVGITLTFFGGVSVAPPNTPITILFGRNHFFEEFCDLRFSISQNAFFQVNTPSAEKLVDTIAEFAGLDGTEDVLDLFCGTGSLGLSVARKSKSVTGVEIIESAVKDAKRNAKANGVENTEFIAGGVETVLPEILERKTFDAVIVDPPRAGLPKKARQTLASLPVKKMILVSCNPATLARDLLELEEVGWKLAKARPHDLFPHTPHVETVAEIVKN